MNNYIYLRVMRHADHVVFCVEKGQKTYYDSQFGLKIPYSSGQQVKRSILNELTSSLNVNMSPAIFIYEIDKEKKLKNKQVLSASDPSYIDQLIGGWMKAVEDKKKKKKAEADEAKEDSNKLVYKRRSPLSISAMRPLHPLLSTLSYENLTFDRSDRPEDNPVIVYDSDGNELTLNQIDEYLTNNNRTLPRRHWIAENARASGLFIYDIAIDLRTLFCVSLNQHEPEISKETAEKLRNDGWREGRNIFGNCLILPESEREKIIHKLADSLINWRITSNQARTFSLMETLAIGISTNANKVANSIRAKLDSENDKPKAKPIIDKLAGAELFVTPVCGGYVETEEEDHNALENAKKRLIELMTEFDYENQISN